MRLMASFFRAYPLQTLLMLTALLLSGLAEGIGLSTLLPLLNIALGHTGAALPGLPADSQSNFGQQILELLAAAEIAPTLGNMLLIIVGSVALKCVFLLLAQSQVGYTAAQMGTDLRLEMLRAVLRSQWEYFLHQPIGKLTNALASEAQRASDAFVCGATAITFLLQAVIYGAVAFALSWQASLLAIGIGIIIIGLSHFLVKISGRAGTQQTRLLTSLVANLTDTLQSVKPLKAMAREHLAGSVLAREARRLNKALRRQVLSVAVLNSMQELLFTAGICFGIYVALQGFVMDLPTVMVLVVALGRAFFFLGKVQKQLQKLAQGESAYWAMKESIATATRAEEKRPGGATPTFERAIEFNNVAFSYDQHTVFENLSLQFPAGSLTTLVGPSGVGKTTLIDLTIGLLQPSAGVILLDGQALQDIDIKRWRDMMGYVPQDTVLLHDTVLRNVTLGDPQFSPDDVQRALQAADAWGFVEQLAAGMDTIVGERGSKLSGGQRQRIVVARALINQPRLLILDEATSALDLRSEVALRQTVERLKGKLSILAISHNRTMVQAADRIYQLTAGGARLLDRSEWADLG